MSLTQGCENEPLVSVIMPVYNEEKHVAVAIESILAQTYRMCELIIIDDNSTDASLHICRSYGSAVTVYTKGNMRRGAASSRNLGVSLARGQFIANQDADDYSDPRRIELQLAAALKCPDRRVVGCGIRKIENGSVAEHRYPEQHGDIVVGFSRFRNRSSIVAGTMLAATHLLRNVPNRAYLRFHEDWDQLLRLNETGRVEFYNCREILYTYHVRPKFKHKLPGWIEDNLFVRASQIQRSHGAPDFSSLEDFRLYLQRNRSARLRWGLLGVALIANDRLSHLHRLATDRWGSNAALIPRQSRGL